MHVCNVGKLIPDLEPREQTGVKVWDGASQCRGQGPITDWDLAEVLSRDRLQQHRKICDPCGIAVLGKAVLAGLNALALAAGRGRSLHRVRDPPTVETVVCHSLAELLDYLFGILIGIQMCIVLDQPGQYRVNV